MKRRDFLKSVGAVAAMTIPEVNRLCNAFCAGAKEVNDKVKCKFSFIGSFFDPPKAKEAALAQIEQGVDVAQLQGSGPGGRIVKQDVLDAVEQGIARAEPAPPLPLLAQPVRRGPHAERRRQHQRRGEVGQVAVGDERDRHRRGEAGGRPDRRREPRVPPAPPQDRHQPDRSQHEEGRGDDGQRR